MLLSGNNASMGRIWLIGGTQESADLSRAIAAQSLPCLITVTTESACDLYPAASVLSLWVGRLGEANLSDFLIKNKISTILDASHPFAVGVSQLAIEAATQFNLPYLRFERPAAIATGLTFPTFAALLATELLMQQRVLLTVGYRPLALFQPWQQRATLFTRILPSGTALQAAIAAGFSPDRIIALRPPISVAMERALWQQWHIAIVVTKASGVAGGEDIKQQVAAELGVTLVTIARPAIDYPQQTSDIQTALHFCQHTLRYTA